MQPCRSMSQVLRMRTVRYSKYFFIPLTHDLLLNYTEVKRRKQSNSNSNKQRRHLFGAIKLALTQWNRNKIYVYFILFSIFCPPLQTFCKNTSETLKLIFRCICSASKCVHAWRTENLPESQATVRTSTPVAIVQQHFATSWEYSVGHISLYNSVSSFLKWLIVATKRF